MPMRVALARKLKDFSNNNNFFISYIFITNAVISLKVGLNGLKLSLSWTSLQIAQN